MSLECCTDKKVLEEMPAQFPDKGVVWFLVFPAGCVSIKRNKKILLTWLALQHLI